MPFCEAGLDWGRGGSDEEKLPAFLRAHGVSITNDKKQLAELYHISKTDRSLSPIARLMAQHLDKPPEFWLEKTWDLDTVQTVLIGDLNRAMEKLLLEPEDTTTRLNENENLSDFLAQLEARLGGTWKTDDVVKTPEDFRHRLVKHVALSAMWKLTGYDESFPFRQEMPASYKIDHCLETISNWLKTDGVGEAYVATCQHLEKDGLNLIGSVNLKGYVHIFPHLILGRWLEEKKNLEVAAHGPVTSIRFVLRKAVVVEYDKTWDRLMSGELGWQWLSQLKEMEQIIAA